jgi:hypothetical protein
MKIKCIKIYDNQGEEQSSSPWLTVGKTYVPLEILCDIRNGVSYRLVGDAKDKSPGVFKAIQFEVITNNKSSNWDVNISEDGFIVIGPKSWRINSFWENCYDGDPNALEIYKREARIIFDEENSQ